METKSAFRCKFFSMFKYEYSLIRSRRRSVSVKIKDDNSLEVRAPLKMPVKDIEKFLLSKSLWIDRVLNKNRALRTEFAEVISYKKVLVGGIPFTLTVCGRNEILQSEVKVSSLKNLKKLYIDAFGGKFLKIFYGLCRQFGFDCRSVNFKDYKAKWGCCDISRNIDFNYKVLMLPENLQYYIAVHELCHTKVMNHSSRFYRIVESVIPDYKDLIKLLKNYSFITRLY